MIIFLVYLKVDSGNECYQTERKEGYRGLKRVKLISLTETN